MTEIAMPQIETAGSKVHVRGRAIRRFAASDNFFRRLTQACALIVLLILGGVIVSLIKGSIPAFQAFGFGFFTTVVWNPVTEKFGAGAPMFGTIVTSAIAMAIAVPFRHRHRRFSHRAVSAFIAPTDRHRRRALGGNPKHYLRTLGLIHIRAVSPGIRAAVPYRAVRQCSRHVFPVRRASLRHRHADRVAHPGDHGPALRDVDFA